MIAAARASQLAVLTALALASAGPALQAQQTAPPPAGDVLRSWPEGTDRTWLGSGLWANRFADWQIADGRVECLGSQLPLRTAHLLTRRILERRGTLRARVHLRSIGDAPHFAGLWIGAGSPELDPRAAALVQSTLGKDGGLLVGLDAEGRAVIRSEPQPNARAGSVDPAELPDLGWAGRDALLDLVVRPDGDGTSSLDVARLDPRTGQTLATTRRGGIPDRAFAGNLALCADLAAPAVDGRVRFESLAVDGSRLGLDDRAAYGPFAGCQYTLSRGTLKLTAQLLPLADDELGTVELQLHDGQGGWTTVDRAGVVTPSYTAHLRVDDWPHAGRAVGFRVRMPLDDAHGATRLPAYAGTIRAEPAPDAVVTLAAFTGNHNVRHGFGRPGYPWNREGLWFPHDDLQPKVRSHAPDLLFFSGDQIYEGASPTPPVRGPQRAAQLDYLYKWTLFLWAWGDLTREIPTVTIPDDHDVWQGNLWGGGGRATDLDTKGGYVMPAWFVRLCERTQTSHLPDPFDPTPVEQGIGVYYTALKWGGVDFAVLEDRKFKSGPLGIVPPTGSNRPDHVKTEDFDPATADVEGAHLLGERQLAFLEAWAGDWSHGTRLKAALSQSAFAGLATHHGGSLDYLVADYDSNGWPQTGRNRTLAALRKCYAFMVGGDQHLATLTWHGIDDWRDAGWSFVVPSIANFYPRMWNPPGKVGARREPGRPEWTGDHLDGFGNKVTVFAATNPGADLGIEPKVLHNGMPGYGIVRFDPVARTITAECWPRHADPSSAAARPYDGWPRTIGQSANDGRQPTAWLPPLSVEGLAAPVVEVRHATTGELVRAWRAEGPRCQLGVFEPGRYVVRVGDPDRSLWQSRVLEAATDRNQATVRLGFVPGDD